MTDNRTTELRISEPLRGFIRHQSNRAYIDGGQERWLTEIADEIDAKHEQAIAATLGRPKAKSHPYGYEPDTGAFDCTRCECGCINDISATYCNDCGGEIEIDMYAEKEIYHTLRHLVFAEKHDDGSLEFGGKRYIAATPGELIVRCRDCRHATISTMGVCKYCEMFVLPDTDGYGADSQVNLPLDFFCGFAERKAVDE